MQEQIERDLKAAMLAGDKAKTEILRGLKSAIQYESLNNASSERRLNDEQVQKVLAKEAKKRQETAELYSEKGEAERAKLELSEKEIIDAYLPKQMDETKLKQIVEEEISKVETPTIKEMGRIIGAVRARTGGSANGATIAKLVKEHLLE